MTFWGTLRRLWRLRPFRRLFLLRVLSQGGDATLQVGMASYVLFSPQTQPNAAAIAMMFAVTLLPFTVVAPFVGVILDRFPRRRIAMGVDSTRAVVAVIVAGIVLSGWRGAGSTACFYAALLLAMSLSRFLLAGLAASLPFVVEDDEYLAANSVMPVVGPLGAALAGVAMAVRIGLSTFAHLPTRWGDAAIFAVAACLFVASVLTARSFAPRGLGPRLDATRSTLRDAVDGLAVGVRALRRTSLAGPAAVLIACQRLLFGLIQVGTILLFRNRFHAVTDVNRALADIGVWAGLTAVGFVSASVVGGPLVRRLGIRRGLAAVMLANAVLQIVPGSILGRVPLWIAAFGLGVVAQSLKIGVDTVTQWQVPDAVLGRVFVIYDLIFNLANVGAAALAVVVLPADGGSLPVFVGAGITYAVLGAGFAFATRGAPDAAEGETAPR